jgi:hypothetical protein
MKSVNNEPMQTTSSQIITTSSDLLEQMSKIPIFPLKITPLASQISQSGEEIKIMRGVSADNLTELKIYYQPDDAFNIIEYNFELNEQGDVQKLFEYSIQLQWILLNTVQGWREYTRNDISENHGVGISWIQKSIRNGNVIEKGNKVIRLSSRVLANGNWYISTTISPK